MMVRGSKSTTESRCLCNLRKSRSLCSLACLRRCFSSSGSCLRLISASIFSFLWTPRVRYAQGQQCKTWPFKATSPQPALLLSFVLAAVHLLDIAFCSRCFALSCFRRQGLLIGSGHLHTNKMRIWEDLAGLTSFEPGKGLCFPKLLAPPDRTRTRLRACTDRSLVRTASKAGAKAEQGLARAPWSQWAPNPHLGKLKEAVCIMPSDSRLLFPNFPPSATVWKADVR